MEPKEEPKKELMRNIKLALALKYAKTDPFPALILDNLYLGSIGAAFSKDKLLELGITHILVIASEIQELHSGEFHYKQVHLEDKGTEDLLGVLSECFGFIDSARTFGKVLVHW